LGGIFTCGIWDIFASTSRTMGYMDRRRTQLDSAHRKGPETHLGRHSNCSGRMFYGREKRIGLDQNSLHTMAPVFLHISRRLLSVLLAEQHGAYSLLPLFARFIVSAQEVCGTRSVCGSTVTNAGLALRGGISAVTFVRRSLVFITIME
jgi:hypothetical protein